ncbi:MAG: NAD(P)-dependent oxidoreductase [Deltaproteobacteria bacterium]|nr:NAD(P)-dependent oxidoreductase [Deltaproteobacteria bacterium]
MKVLVTGSNGFLGATLVRRLCERGETYVRCLHRPGSNLRRLAAVQADHPGAELDHCVGNLTSPEDCARAIDGVDLVYHGAAALTGAAADMFLNTVVASKNLLEAVRRSPRPARIVQVSSFGVYGMAGVEEGSVVTEDTPLEPHPELRDLYSQAKLRQEQLFWEYRERHQLPIAVVRPGVVYGPSGPAMSNRVGLRLFGLFLHLGRRNLLPLTYVDNCADALVDVARSPESTGQVYNVVDDDLPTARAYLDAYRREVERLRVVSLPLFATLLLSRLVAWYHAHSRGQLPAIFTPYKTNSMWRSFRYDNSRLKSLGWRPRVSTAEGMRRTFEALRAAAAAR